MSQDDLGDFFALPAFKPEEALVKLRRDLRELKLAERGAGEPWRYELKGLAVVELALAPDGPKLAVAQARKPSQRPEWSRQSLASSTDVRKWLDGLKAQLRRWEDED
ncbi:MAG: hypothetical protein RI907_2115 [Pseudomonadota bacterium]|jgi:hypothetical protein